MTRAMKLAEAFAQSQRERIAALSDAIKGAHILVENQRQQLAMALRERDAARSLLASTTDLMNTCAREWRVAESPNESGIKQLFGRLWAEFTSKYFALRTRLEAAEKNMREIAAGNKYLVRSGGLGCLTDDCDHWDAGCEIGTLCHIGRTIDVAAIDAARETKT